MKSIAENRPNFRAYSSDLELNSTSVSLSAVETNHLINVMRARPGNLVALFNGSGLEALGEIATLRKSCQISIHKTWETHRDKPEIVLAQGLPKGKTMDSVVRKCCELGVNRIIPLKTENSEFQLTGRREQSKIEKWKSAAIEGCKQSCNSFVPKIETPISLDEFISFDVQGNLYVGAIHPIARPISSFAFDFKNLNKGSEMIYIIVGPEGDFSKLEYESLDKIGASFYSLGPLVLKVVTAVTVSVFSFKSFLSE